MTRRGFGLEDLRQWSEFGGRWRVVASGGDRVTLELCACTGEVMDRVVSDDPGVIAQAEGRAGLADEV